MLLSRDQLLGSFERRYLDVPTLIGTVRIQNLTEAEKTAIESNAWTKDGKFNRAHLDAQRRLLIAAVLVDQAGNLLLGKGDVDRLKEIDAAVASEIFAAAARHTGFDRNPEKNSGDDSGEVPGSDSPTD